MPDAQDMARSIGELQERQQGLRDGLSGLASGLAAAGRGLREFFHSPDNVLALLICLAALVGIYRLLRAEHIIPAPADSGGPLGGFGRGTGLRLAAALAAILAALALMAWLTGA
ncbi:MAG: hypothetical protein ACP59X_06310 [Solidesulfovibrio sp. DCME]|uniref:hypothetical protein n=1 Tax=Solidesulfovibrio sp. DCME TaxID=3447380 RepID=UPI003D09645E